MVENKYLKYILNIYFDPKPYKALGAWFATVVLAETVPPERFYIASKTWG